MYLWCTLDLEFKFYVLFVLALHYDNDNNNDRFAHQIVHHSTQSHITKLEAVQRRAARTVYNIPRTDHKTSTTQLVDQLTWQTLDSRRNWRRLGLFRAIHYNEVAINMSDYIQPHPHQSSTRRHDQQYLIPHCNTDIHKKSFFVSTAKLWNNLPCNCSLLVGPPVAG